MKGRGNYSLIITAEHPNGEKVEFDEGSHTYTVVSSGQTLTSATTWISQFFPEFHAEAVAAKCAGKGKYLNMSKEEILAAWEAEGERGRTEGTCAHLYAENRLLGRPLPEPISERVEQLFISVDIGIDTLLKHYNLIGTEVILFDAALGIAGTADLLMHHPATRALLILDWKNNKEIKTSNKWERAFKPVSHLESCDRVKYALQFSLYKRLILNGGYFKNLDWDHTRLGLIHLRPGEAPVMMKIEALDEEINAMLECNSPAVASETGTGSLYSSGSSYSLFPLKGRGGSPQVNL